MGYDVLLEALRVINFKAERIGEELRKERNIMAAELEERTRLGLTGDAAVKHYEDWMSRYGNESSINNKKNEEAMELIKCEMKPNGLTMDVDKNEFALALKTWRLRSGLTQDALAKKWGCSRYTIMRAENAKQVTWEMAYRLFARLSHELQLEGKGNG